MAFNKDIHSLFDRYVKNILQEQGPPKPVEVGPDDPINNQVSPGNKISRNDAIKQWEQMTGKTYSSLTPEQKRQTARFLIQGMQTGQVTPPASLQGRLQGRPDPSTAAGQAAIAQNQQDIAAKQQQQADARKAQEESDRQSLQRIQNTGSNTSQPATTSPSSTTTATGTETQAQKEARWAAEAQAANAQTALNKATGSTNDTSLQPSKQTPEELATLPKKNTNSIDPLAATGWGWGNTQQAIADTRANQASKTMLSIPTQTTPAPQPTPSTPPTNSTDQTSEFYKQPGDNTNTDEELKKLGLNASTQSTGAGGYTPEQIAAFNKANSAGRKDWEFDPNSRVDREKMQKMLGSTGQQPNASAALPGAGMKPGEVKTPTPTTTQQPQPQQQQQMGGVLGGISRGVGAAGTAAKTALVGNQPLGGIAGGISKGIGSIGNVAKNVLTGRQQNTKTTQASQTQSQQAKQQRPKFNYQKVR